MMPRVPTARLLPVTIAAIGCVLLQRVVLLAWALGAPLLPMPSLFGSTAAQAAESAPPAPPARSVEAKKPDENKPEAARAESEPSPDLAGLLADLRARREQLAVREQALATREALLSAAQTRINDRVAELAALQTQLAQLDAARRAHEGADWAGLVKLYETMKPREAATIFNDLDPPVLIGLLDRMKEAKAALVLGAMAPDRARDATAALAAARAQRVAPPGGAGRSAKSEMGKEGKGI